MSARRKLAMAGGLVFGIAVAEVTGSLFVGLLTGVGLGMMFAAVAPPD